jgi:hypothetical protein
VTGVYYDACLQCVQADGQHMYLGNCTFILFFSVPYGALII